MALEIRPAWDRSETVSVRLCAHRRELVVSAGSLAGRHLRPPRRTAED